MFRLPIVKPTFFNQQMNNFCLKLTKESINKYTKKIEDLNKSKDKSFGINLDLETSTTNPNNNPNNNPYIVIYCIGVFSFVSIFYFFIKSKR